MIVEALHEVAWPTCIVLTAWAVAYALPSLLEYLASRDQNDAYEPYERAEDLHQDTYAIDTSELERARETAVIDEARRVLRDRAIIRALEHGNGAVK
jgi:hypothetical protein